MFNKKNKRAKNEGPSYLTSGSHSEEQYKNLRANIAFMEIDNKYKKIMVTSPEAGAGKTTTSVNLASAFAQKGVDTLIVAADLRKPSLNDFFSKTSSDRNLVSVLLKKCELTDAIKRVPGEDNLYILEAGPVPPNPAELLESVAMKELMDVLGQNFDRVIIDAPPVLPVVDAKVLSTMADGIVIVARSEVTERDSMVKTVSELSNSPAKLLGTVLNDASSKNGNYYYYY